MFNRWFCLIMICLISTLYGCSPSVKFVDFKSIDSRTWQTSDTKFFIFNNKSSHTVGDLYLCLNYTILGHDKQIEIEIEAQTPTRKHWINRYKISLEPTNRYGKIESRKEVKLIEKCEFTDIGIYKFNVRLASPHYINEITSIGVAIK